jgi:hypothetical protein
VEAGEGREGGLARRRAAVGGGSSPARWGRVAEQGKAVGHGRHGAGSTDKWGLVAADEYARAGQRGDGVLTSGLGHTVPGSGTG